MDLNIISLVLSMIFMTAGLFSASRLMGVSLSIGQALIAGVVMSLVSSAIGPNSRAGGGAFILAFVASTIPLKLMTKESMWSTIKLSIFGTIIGAVLLMAVAKVVFPISIPLTKA